MRLPKLTIAGADAVAPSLPNTADPEVQVWRDHDGTVCAYGHTDDEVHWIHLPNLASFRFGGGEDGVTAIPRRLVREDRLPGVYYRSVLPIVLQARGQEALHASAVLTSKGVVALCATSGTGKSTTAFGLSKRGWPLWADDAVAFQTLDTCVKAVPLPFDLRLLSDATAHFEQESTTVRTDPSGNGVVDRIGQEPVPLTALLLLSRAHDGEEEVVRIRRPSAAKAFIDVLTQAYCFNPRDEERKRSMTQHYLDLVAQVPVFEIRFQPGLERLPTVLDSIRLLVHRTLDEAL